MIIIDFDFPPLLTGRAPQYYDSDQLIEIHRVEQYVGGEHDLNECVSMTGNGKIFNRLKVFTPFLRIR